MNPIAWWQNHGTKILGSLIALLGAVLTLSPDTLTGIFGEKAPSITVTIAGLLTFLRGFTNTKNLPDNKQNGRATVGELLVLTVVISLVLLACTTFSSLSLDEKLGASEISVTHVVKAATTAVNAGTLSSANGQSVLTMAQGAKGIIASARAAELAGDTAAASTGLALATSALTALQTFLNAKAGTAAQPPPAPAAMGPKTSYYATDPAEKRLALTEI